MTFFSTENGLFPSYPESPGVHYGAETAQFPPKEDLHPSYVAAPDAQYDTGVEHRHLGMVRDWLLSLWSELRGAWLDIASIILLSAVSSVIYNRVPIFRQGDRVFAVETTQAGDWMAPISISLPLWNDNAGQKWLIPVYEYSLALSFGTGFLLFLTQSIYDRRITDTTRTIIGLYKAFAVTTVTQCSLKTFVGEFRPNFMAICGSISEPSLRISGRTWARVSDCPVWKEHNGSSTALVAAMESFPSGHTAQTFCAMTYLTLFMNAKLRPLEGPQAFWRLLLECVPTYFALCISCSVLIDHNHHLHDVLLSIPLGVVIGVVCYYNSHSRN